MPFVDGGIVLESRIGAAPCGVGNFFPKVFSRYLFHYFAIGAAFEFPIFVVFEGVEEVIWNANGVVGVLSTHGAVGFTFIVVAVPGSDEGGHFLFFFNFPIDEFFDFGVIHIEADHFSGATCGATTFDSASGAVANFKEAH